MKAKVTPSQILMIDDITVPSERLREISKAGVESIANSFDTVGQLQAVLVARDKAGDLLLHAGGHRYEAARKLGWHHIEAKEIDLTGLSDEMAAIVISIVEVDENLSRVDLDQAGRVRFMGKRIELTRRRNDQQKAETAKAELAAANAARSEALAAQKKAKGKEAKAAAVKRFEEAEQARKAADDRVRNSARRCSPAGEDHLASKRIDPETMDDVSKELGLKRAVVSNLNSFRNTLGDDFLKAVEGTRLGTKSELQAMVTMKKRYPEKAAWLVAHTIKRRAENAVELMYPPSGELGKLTSADALDAKNKSLATPEGKRENFRKVVVELQSEVQKLVQALGLLDRGERQDHPEVQRMQADIATLVARTKKVPEQKRTGTEHRYGGDKEGPTRAEAEKELQEHADEIEKVLKSKSKSKKK